MMHNMNYSELDSFYESHFCVFSSLCYAVQIELLLRNSGFMRIDCVSPGEKSVETLVEGRYDIIIFEITKEDDYDLLSQFRRFNTDAALIILSDSPVGTMVQLTLKIETVLLQPFKADDLIKATKKALGSKNNFEIGMQFFDALFGMQMCTHRDLHQRTFEHAIRTTQIYGKFLLSLMETDVIKLTSWTLKNCLMASLVHDIGKLLVMQGILYKEGRLTELEYQQIKRHPWHSVTALLGGQDIEFFAGEGPIETVSGYNDKNLSEMTKQWIFKVIDSDKTAYNDLESFFESLYRKPFIHSLNKDLLYIVFRHHDAVNKSYHNIEDLQLFSKIIDRPFSEKLNDKSYLDVVTNALSLCDFYDALLDKKRDYRKRPFNRSFILYFLYLETRNGRFFPLLTEEFIKYITRHEIPAEENVFCESNDPHLTLQVIKKIDSLFRIAPGQEYEFNQFAIEKSSLFRKYAENQQEDFLISINEEWVKYYTIKHAELVDEFYGALKHANLVSRDIKDFTVDEVKVFDMLFNFYQSYPSSIKQKKLIDYFVDSVTKRTVSETTKQRLIDLLKSSDIKTIPDMKKTFVKFGYERDDLFEVFRSYNEELLLTEFNQEL
jgi:DNA-binding NarL/FixJ family response regulator